MRSIFSLLLLTLLLVVPGCTPPNDPMLEMLDSEINKTKVDDLSRTMDFIFSEVRFSQQEFKEKLSSGLNRWVSYSDDKINKATWSLDELSKPLFDKNSSLQLLERNEEFSFLNTDAYYLQQSAWISQIVERLKEKSNLNAFELYRLAADDYKATDDVEDPIREVVTKLNEGLDDEAAETLSDSLKVFDWVTRNILLIDDTQVEDGQVDELRLNEREESLAAAGVVGPGYKRYVWQTLLYGRGDAVERAKLFMLCLRNLDIDSVLFATKSGKPWCVGVPAGGKYYLFDAKMGLPIPGKKSGSIATLAEVRSNDELLTGLDLTNEESLEDETDYWVKPDEIKELDALIYITPESVSKRMAALENSLTGEDRLILAFSADDITSRLPKSEGVEFKSWDIAFKTHAFRQAVGEALEQKSDNDLQDRLDWHGVNEAYIDGFVIYRTARSRFLKGKFRSDPEARSLNAVESFRRLMYTDEDVDNLGTDARMQRLLGIRKEIGQNAQQFQTQLRSVQFQMKLIRRDAGYFMTQCLFDNGSINAAANWLKVFQDENDSERWKDGITYLQGRAYEGLKEYDKAVDTLGDTKSTQAHGNLIRARLLKQLVAKLYGE